MPTKRELGELRVAARKRHVAARELHPALSDAPIKVAPY